MKYALLNLKQTTYFLVLLFSCIHTDLTSFFLFTVWFEPTDPNLAGKVAELVQDKSRSLSKAPLTYASPNLTELKVMAKSIIQGNEAKDCQLTKDSSHYDFLQECQSLGKHLLHNLIGTLVVTLGDKGVVLMDSVSLSLLFNYLSLFDLHSFEGKALNELLGWVWERSFVVRKEFSHSFSSSEKLQTTGWGSHTLDIQRKFVSTLIQCCCPGGSLIMSGNSFIWLDVWEKKRIWMTWKEGMMSWTVRGWTNSQSRLWIFVCALCSFRGCLSVVFQLS